MDTIASMRAFVAVAKAGSFSAAAQKLDLVPSVITKRVTQLERIVGTTLFHRSTRRVVLSADGEHHLVPIDRLKMPRVNALLRFIRSKGGGPDSVDARSVRSTAKSAKK
jgi:DNA-binding transcriptional LysR family regulator